MTCSLTLRWMLLLVLGAIPTPSLRGAYRILNITVYYHYWYCKADYGILYSCTSVSGALEKLYLLSSSMRAILASNRANLIPMQIREPKPNGMHVAQLRPLGFFFWCKPIHINVQ